MSTCSFQWRSLRWVVSVCDDDDCDDDLDDHIFFAMLKRELISLKDPPVTSHVACKCVQL